MTSKKEIRFKFNDFIVFVEEQKIEKDEKYLHPIKLNSDKTRVREYELRNRVKEFIAFTGLSFLDKEDEKFYIVISDLFDFIEFVELLKAFSSKKLVPEETYNISDKLEARIARKNGVSYLSIQFKNYSDKLFLGKFQCSSLAAKFSKILSRCEPWQESDQ
jgi:hypothetical protein